MKKIIKLCVVILFGLQINTFAQVDSVALMTEDTTFLPNSSIHLTGSFLGLGLAAGVSYERFFYEGEHMLKQFGFKAGLAHYIAWESENRVFSSGFTGLLFDGNHHIELSGSVGVEVWWASFKSAQAYAEANISANVPEFKDYVGIFPLGNVGYRFQRPTGGFLFRVGIGMPEVFYIGIGRNF